MAQGDLAIARDDNPVAAADGKDGGGVENGRVHGGSRA
jgi:hypothetical protein